MQQSVLCMSEGVKKTLRFLYAWCLQVHVQLHRAEVLQRAALQTLTSALVGSCVPNSCKMRALRGHPLQFIDLAAILFSYTFMSFPFRFALLQLTPLSDVIS